MRENNVSDETQIESTLTVTASAKKIRSFVEAMNTESVQSLLQGLSGNAREVAQLIAKNDRDTFGQTDLRRMT